MRNYKRASKFQPLFLPDPLEAITIADDGRYLYWLNIDLMVIDFNVIWNEPRSVRIR